MKISLILADNKFLSFTLKILIFVISRILRIPKLFHSCTKSIVILNFHRLGDSVFTIPALKEILKQFNTNIYIFCFEETKPIFETAFKKEILISFSRSAFHLNTRIAGSMVRKKLREVNPEKVIDLTGSTLSASVLITSTSEAVIGSNEDYYKLLYTKFTSLRTKPHVMDIYLDVARLIIPGINDLIKEFKSEINKEGFLLLHPYAGWKAKEWNLTKFITLAEKLNKKYRLIIVAEPGKLSDEIIIEIMNRDIEVIETRNIYELMQIIDKCSIFISNDSGPLYIANMLGTPTFTIYGPTNPEYSLPYGKNHQFIQKKIKCSPQVNEQYCFTNAGRIGCPSFECMNLLDVEEVFESLSGFINELGIYQNKSFKSI